MVRSRGEGGAWMVFLVAGLALLLVLGGMVIVYSMTAHKVRMAVNLPSARTLRHLPGPPQGPPSPFRRPPG